MMLEIGRSLELMSEMGDLTDSIALASALFEQALFDLSSLLSWNWRMALYRGES